MALGARLGLNLLNSAANMLAALPSLLPDSLRGIILEDGESFLLLEDNVSVLELENG